MNEHDYALRDAAMAEFVDSYFKARPQLLRTRHEECLVEAGFKAAWQPDQKERAEKAEAELARLKSAPVRGMNEEMLERVDQEARRRYRKFMSSTRGTTITASDSFESWLVWVSWEFAMNECHSDHYSMLGRIAELEAELAKLREQKPVCWHVRGNYFHDGDAAILFASMNSMCGAKVEQLYAAPVPAVAAPAVPEDYRQALVEIALRCTDHDATDAIDALLQSAPQSEVTK